MSDTLGPAVTAPSEQPARSRKGRRIFALVLVVLALMLAGSVFLLFRVLVPPGAPTADTDTGGLVWVRSIYGMSNLPEDQFSRVQAAVPAPDGTIWVVDGSQMVMMAFTPDGRFIRYEDGPAELPLRAPSRFAIGPDGRFYVCETHSDTVRILNPDGSEAGSLEVPSPVSVAVSENRIVVGAVDGFAVFDQDGELIRAHGSRGPEHYQFDYVHGVAIAENGNIFIVDSFNNRLSAWSPDGALLWMTRTGNPGNDAQMVDGRLTVQEAPDVALAEGDMLQLPLGVTIDGAGRIVVIDKFECALAVFNPEDGSFIGKYGVPGPEEGQFFYPVSVSYDASRDWFTVADSQNNRAQIVRIPGSSENAVLATVQRGLAGPLRACFLPFVLLLVALIVWFTVRARRRARERRLAAASDAIADEGDT